jgi:hypothetical protein
MAADSPHQFAETKDEEQQCRQHSSGEAPHEGAEARVSKPANLEGHRLGETKVAREELLHTAQELEEEAGRTRPHGASSEAPRELVSQGGEREGSPGVRGGVCGRAQCQVDLAMESLTNAVGYHLVPMYRVIGLLVPVALLILFLMGILRMALDIRAIAITRVRGCGWQGSHLSDDC